MSTIAQEPNILEVLDVAGSWWVSWQDHYSGFKEIVATRSLRDTVKFYLADERPIMVACGLCCIAMSLQHLRQGIDDGELHLSTSPKELMDRYLAAVDQLVLSNESYVSNIDGLLTFLIRGKIFAESNQLRKAWLHIRKAIHVGQKINLAGCEHPTFDLLQRQRFMGGLFETDRSMSLILGLPYAVDDNFNDKYASRILSSGGGDIVTRMRALKRITSIAAGHVNDRNAASSESSASTTLQIQQTLDNAYYAMPAEWWSVPTHANNFGDPQLTHEHLMAQLWFYQVQTLLQLPFMLRASTDPLFEPSRTACLQAIRQLLKIYITLREHATLSTYTCKCEDFQGMVGAIILMVALLQYSSQDIEPCDSSFEQDLELLDATKLVFEYASSQQGGSIAKQGLQILNTLGAFLHNDDNSPTSDKQPPRTATLFVPYFGTISVQSGAGIRRFMPSKRTSTITDHNLPAPLLQDSAVASVGSEHSQFECQNNFAKTDYNVDEAYTGYSWPTTINDIAGKDGQITSAESVGLNLLSPENLEPFANMSSDWDKIMFGSELDQDWNYCMPNNLTRV